MNVTTLQGLLHQAVNELTASMGWIEMDDKQKAAAHVKLCVGLLLEVQMRLQKLCEDFELPPE